MAEFAYRARDRRGSTVSGVLTAASQDDATRHLRSQGMTVLGITMRSSGGRLGGLGSIQIIKPRVKAADIAYFANQLAIMVDTGVPLPEALDALTQQAQNPTFKEVLTKVAADVEAGGNFSESLEKHPKVFNAMFVSLVRAGEASGNLGSMLNNVADYLVEANETRKKISGAMIYPACMMGLAIVVVVVLMTAVLPKFTKIYANKGAVLPAPTRALLALSDLFTQHYIWIIVVVAALVAGVILTLRHPKGRRLADTLRLKLPIIGNVCQKIYIARSFRALGTMIAAGVPVIGALEIARRTVTNCHFVEVIDHAIEKVSEGETLSDQFFSTQLIPVTTSQMIFAGEKSGRLGEVLLKVSQFCDRDLNAAIKQMTSMLEPLLIGFMGLVVGGIALALLVPMFTISKVITK